MHILLGFDLRKCASEYFDGFWLNERRREYLLRPSVRWPLSVDRLVWPPVFDLSKSVEYCSADAIAVEATTTVQLGLKLWDDRGALEQTFQKQDGRTCVVRLAVELCLDHALAEDPEWNFLDGALPVKTHDVRDWTLAGYDVADRYLLSGLMNCGYTEQELNDLQEWPERLNDFGLFDQVEAAEKFRRVTEARVSEHAPFFVYRLWVDLNGIVDQ